MHSHSSGSLWFKSDNFPCLDLLSAVQTSFYVQLNTPMQPKLFCSCLPVLIDGDHTHTHKHCSAKLHPCPFFHCVEAFPGSFSRCFLGLPLSSSFFPINLGMLSDFAKATPAPGIAGMCCLDGGNTAVGRAGDHDLCVPAVPPRCCGGEKLFGC